MKTALVLFLFFLFFPGAILHAESFRAMVEGSVTVSHERPAEGPVSIGINGSLLINLDSDTRFLRGIEIEITCPQGWLQYSGALVKTMYNNIEPKTASGVVDFTG